MEGRPDSRAMKTLRARGRWSFQRKVSRRIGSELAQLTSERGVRLMRQYPTNELLTREPPRTPSDRLKNRDRPAIDR